MLVGDPDQLSSVEAGAVLADVVRAPGVPDPGRPAGWPVVGRRRPMSGPVHGVVRLTDLAVRRGDRRAGPGDPRRGPTRVLAVLRAASPDVRFIEVDLEAESGRRPCVSWPDRGHGTGAAPWPRPGPGDVAGALAALDQHRLLCGHRRGPYGVGRWSLEVERWLAEAVPGYAEDGEWYLGRPLLVTANDYEMGLYNGDTGVIVDAGGAAPRVLPAAPRRRCSPRSGWTRSRPCTP